MECPYCNQEHDEGMAFCPITGGKLYVITQRTCYEKSCPLNRYNLPCYYNICPACGREIISVSFWGKNQNEDCLPDLELNNQNSYYCDLCGFEHIKESRFCPIKEKSIKPYKVCAQCGSRVISSDYKFCSKCGSDKFKKSFFQTSASKSWDSAIIILKVIVTVPLVVLGVMALPLIITGQPYSVLIFNWVKKMWSDDF